MDKNWILNNLVEQRDICFRFYGVSHWMRALCLLLPDIDCISNFYKNKNITLNKDSEKAKVSLKNVCEKLTMAISYFDSLSALNNIDKPESILRPAIIIWYYGIYFSSQAMLTSTDSKCCPETHTKTANMWSNIIAKNCLAIEPFNLNLNSLVKNDIKHFISNHPEFENINNKKPKTVEEAKTYIFNNLQGTANYLRDFYEKQIKKDKKIESFRSRENKNLRDSKLKTKNCCFLHQAYRVRGKANYRDMGYLIFYDNKAIMKEFTTDLLTVLHQYCMMAIYYCKRKFNNPEFDEFLLSLFEKFSSFKTKIN